jgi:hypothetical protein
MEVVVVVEVVEVAIRCTTYLMARARMAHMAP